MYVYQAADGELLKMEPQGIDPRTSRKFRLQYEYHTHSIHAKRALYHMSYDPVLYIGVLLRTV